MRKIVLSVFGALLLVILGANSVYAGGAGSICYANNQANPGHECDTGLFCVIPPKNSTGTCQTTRPTSPGVPKNATVLESCPGGGQGIKTAIGCVPVTNQSDLINFILTWAIGVGGGIAFLLILYAGFQIMSSQGDPQRLKAGQELLTAAISGVIMLVFSVFILRVIGVNILGI